MPRTSPALPPATVRLPRTRTKFLADSPASEVTGYFTPQLLAAQQQRTAGPLYPQTPSLRSGSDTSAVHPASRPTSPHTTRDPHRTVAAHRSASARGASNSRRASRVASTTTEQGAGVGYVSQAPWGAAPRLQRQPSVTPATQSPGASIPRSDNTNPAPSAAASGRTASTAPLLSAPRAPTRSHSALTASGRQDVQEAPAHSTLQTSPAAARELALQALIAQLQGAGGPVTVTTH
ncbi:MAG: hypothetical protein WDW38_004854 [Sanguina aurantia]